MTIRHTDLDLKGQAIIALLILFVERRYMEAPDAVSQLAGICSFLEKLKKQIGDWDVEGVSVERGLLLFCFGNIKTHQHMCYDFTLEEIKEDRDADKHVSDLLIEKIKEVS